VLHLLGYAEVDATTLQGIVQLPAWARSGQRDAFGRRQHHTAAVQQDARLRYGAENELRVRRRSGSHRLAHGARLSVQPGPQTLGQVGGSLGSPANMSMGVMCQESVSDVASMRSMPGRLPPRFIMLASRLYRVPPRDPVHDARPAADPQCRQRHLCCCTRLRGP
jgi:hypothetical protein